jgi:hypothetical protein
VSERVGKDDISKLCFYSLFIIEKGLEHFIFFVRKERASMLKLKIVFLRRLDDEDGILVSGGVDSNNRPLASVEFFSIPKQVYFFGKDMLHIPVK